MCEFKSVPTVEPSRLGIADELGITGGQSYYDRPSHETSAKALELAAFIAPPALTSGGVASLFLDGWPVWVATALGAALGMVVGSLCIVSARAEAAASLRERRRERR